MSYNSLELERFAYLPEGTYGKLYLPDGTVLFTVERPWLNNQVNVSCIPEGTYSLIKRPSYVVQRSTNNEFSAGWEVANVPGRTYIMLHPANWPQEVMGCIAMGMGFGHIPNSEPYYAVLQSRVAFRKLMACLDTGTLWRLQVSTMSSELRSVH